MRKILFLILCVLFALNVFSQQDPHYTQYMYNQSVVNPAYVTNDLGVINFGVIHRRQWASAIGAPKTYTGFIHAPITDKFEVGVSIITDNIGGDVLKENNIYADFAYILPINENHKLSLGLKAGFTNFNTNFTGFRLPDGDVTNDEAFNQGSNKTLPNFGVGAFYFTKKYYVGISAPNLIKTEHLESVDNLTSIGGEELHLFANGGYVFTLSDVLKLKPAFMLKAVKGSPIVLDTSVNVLFNNKFEGGLSYRLDDSLSAMFNVRAFNTLRIGYAFDYTTTNLGNFNSGTHEIMLLFDFDTLDLKKGYDKSPRFF